MHEKVRGFLMASKLGLCGKNKQKSGGAQMKNIEMSVEGQELIIKVDLSQSFGRSTSGKSIIIASTEGNQSIPGNEEIKIGLNIYKKAE